MRRNIAISLGLLVAVCMMLWSDVGSGQASGVTDVVPNPSESELPSFANGPYIADPQVMTMLDHHDPGGDCGKSGALVFPCLIQALVESGGHQAPVGSNANPFNLKVGTEIRKTIEADLAGFRLSEGISEAQQIHPGFLTHPGSRMELVGIVNRIDRQFIKDIVPGSERSNRCGEISLIYRFSYAIDQGNATSRLPVTMNVVLPAVSGARQPRLRTCKDVASAWLSYMEKSGGRSAADMVADIQHPDGGTLFGISGREIERIELNIQAFRISAQADTTGLGSTAEYVIRVFRWNKSRGMFLTSYLTNQIDRARLLGASKGDANSCDFGVSKPMSKQAFLKYLLDPVVLSDIDTGTLNIPDEFLACRATSVSPGGQSRSRNSLYWKSPDTAANLISDSEIEEALKKARTPNRQFSFIRSADDVRLRLNELSCTGCHQSRAVAGFHFPGADRKATATANAVLLAGSPHFYGDQLRRTDILRSIANGQKVNRYALAVSYASRPLNVYKDRLGSSQLLGGWGGTCLMPVQRQTSQRQWGCKAGLVCQEIFESKNSPGLGTCVPEGRQEVGDALQQGRVTTMNYGQDTYTRLTPKSVDTLIPPESLPSTAPPGNSYYGAHQEWYLGRAQTEGESADQRRRRIRDAQTGGFPGGMLRLSECRNLPAEATCGLVASSGFNDCLAVVGRSKTLSQCFGERTSYAGMRACDVANPCRDDYICLKPLNYTSANVDALHEQRRINVPYVEDDFGQQKPDTSWLMRNGGLGDRRGICIPPYFVFQFRSDKHPEPLSRDMK